MLLILALLRPVPVPVTHRLICHATGSSDCCHHPSRASKVDQLRGTDLEKKVKEATSNENWGAPNSLLREIARASFD